MSKSTDRCGGGSKASILAPLAGVQNPHMSHESIVCQVASSESFWRRFRRNLQKEASSAKSKTHARKVYRGARKVGTHPTEETILTGVCRKKKKNKKIQNVSPPKEKDLSAGCLLRAPPRGQSFFISVNPYTHRSDVRELLNTLLR